MRGPEGGQQPEVGEMPRLYRNRIPRPGPLAYPHQQDISRPLTAHTRQDGEVGSPGSGSVLKLAWAGSPPPGAI